MDQRNTERLRSCLGDYLRQRGLPTRKAFRCLNPEHEDKHPSMSYNRGAENVHCFSCGVAYDLFDLVGMDYGLDGFPERLRKAAELFDFPLEEPRLRVVDGVRTSLFQPDPVAPSLHQGTALRLSVQWSDREVSRDLTPAAEAPSSTPLHPQPNQGFGPAFSKGGGCRRSPRSCGTSPQVWAPQLPDRGSELEELRQGSSGTYDYFLSRGISRESCEKHDLFQTSDRAIFPVLEEGRVTGWCGRALTDEIQPRYRNSTGGLGLWNGDRLREQGEGRLLCITEGIVDALLLEEMGLAAVALCGSQNGNKLLGRLEASSANSWRFLMCGDGDAAGRKMNEVLLDKLTGMGLGASVLTLPEGADVGSLYQADREALKALLEEAGTGGALSGESESAAYAATCAAAALEDFLAGRERGEDGVSTGIPALDKLLDGGLHPGLYVMGAISSLGKTSLALQMADYISANERDVLFITLEQSRRELMAKSLSRISAELDGDGKKAFTVRELLGGATLNLHRQELLRDSGAVYAETARGLFFREGLCDIGPGDIRGMVREHLTHRGQAPVVVVDYLQILKPGEPRATDKQNVDRAVVELKRLSRDFDVPVLCISSFNRENYKAAVSMEAFKESGAVEYSADVLLGLQLRGAGEKGFDVNLAKVKAPRELELVVLKNRNGAPWAKVPLCYDARCNRFWEPERAAIGRFA